MNQVVLIGRITRDIQENKTQAQKSVANFTLAVDRMKKDDGADFISCQAWGKTAELLSKYCHRGDEIAISGHIRTGSYEKDGRKIYTTDVVAERIKFLRKKGSSSQQDESEAQAQDGFMDATDADLPF